MLCGTVAQFASVTLDTKMSDFLNGLAETEDQEEDDPFEGDSLQDSEISFQADDNEDETPEVDLPQKKIQVSTKS